MESQLTCGCWVSNPLDVVTGDLIVSALGTALADLLGIITALLTVEVAGPRNGVGRLFKQVALRE